MSTFKVGIIGCGRPWKTVGATGTGMAHHHVKGYLASAACELVAAVDVKKENLDSFCEQYHLPKGYLDYRKMLVEEKPDIVSVCLWPHLHAPVVIDAAQAGVKAIHCEKPMATTWADAKKMVAVCEEHHVQLTFNHQRRFGVPFRKAKALLESGAIGELTRLEAFTDNLYDWGTHWFDMMFFYNDETPAEWVMGQIDARGSREIFGAMVEGQGLSFIKWQNEVFGLMVTSSKLFGSTEKEKVRETICGNRLIGTEGVIEVGIEGGPKLRFKNPETAGQWEEDNEGEIHSYELVIAAILDLVEALKTGREPELSGRRALQATELIFATYESSRSRQRVDLPLAIEDSPFLAMLEANVLLTAAG